MATVTGFSIGIDTNSVNSLAVGDNAELVDYSTDFITARIDGRLLTFFGSFDFSSMKALNRSPVTGFDVRLDDPAGTPVIEVSGLTQTFASIDKGDFNVYLAGPTRSPAARLATACSAGPART